MGTHKQIKETQMNIQNKKPRLKRGTGIRGLRGMATLLQGNQELLVVRDKVGGPQVSLG